MFWLPLTGMNTITASETWVPPSSSVAVVMVRAQGSGGGAGGGQGASGIGDDPGGSGGGGGSGVCRETILGISGSVSVTIGAGGAGGAGTAAASVADPGESGSAGSSSSFGTFSADGGYGGTGGQLTSDAPGGGITPTPTPGGDGTASHSNPIFWITNSGNRGFAGGQGTRVGGGAQLAGQNSGVYAGGARGTVGAVGIGSGAGGGGSSNWGAGGAGGDGGSGVTPGDPGETPAAYGAGGGGGGGAATASVSGTSGGDGGSGAGGVVEVYWFWGNTGGFGGECAAPSEATQSCWKLFRIEWLQDPEPQDLTHWESQESTHGYHGFHFERDAFLEIRSEATVALTVEVDGTTQATYSIASTAGQRRKVYIPFIANKGKLYRYLLDSSVDFHVYAFRVRTKGWEAAQYEMKSPLTGTESPDIADVIRGPDPRII